MNKKFISSILAGAMVVSMAGMNAFAAESTEVLAKGDDDSYGKDYEVSTTIQPVTLDVTIPTAINVILNPYELETTLETSNADSTKLASSVASPAYRIVNKGKTNVAVSVTGSVAVTDTTNKNVKFLTAAATKDSATKDVFLYVKMGKDAAAVTGDAAKTDLVLGTKDVTKANYYVIAKKETTDVEAYVKVNGTVNGKADAQWTDADNLTINLKFKFEATGKDASTT